MQPGDPGDADPEAVYQDLHSKRRRSSHQAIELDSKRANKPCAFFNHAVRVVSGSLGGDVVVSLFCLSVTGTSCHT